MRVPVVGGHEVRIVVADHRQVEFLGQPGHVRVEVALQLLFVVLHLDEETRVAFGRGLKDFLVPLGFFDRAFPVRGVFGLVELLDVVSERRAEVAVDRDQPVGPLFEGGFVHPRLEVEAVEVRVAGKLEQVVPALLVLGEQDEVEPAVGHAGELAVGAVGWSAVDVGRDVGLDAEDGLDAFFFREVVKLNRVVQIAVVGHRDGVHAEFFHTFDQPVEPVRAVQQRVLAVQVQVDKRVGGGLGSHP